MKTRHKRALWIVGGLAALAVAAGLILNALNSNLEFFKTPTQIANGEVTPGRTIKIGGMVKKGTVKREGTRVDFIVTDMAKEIKVSFVGILPDLFKEGTGVVAQGKLQGDGRFIADKVLAKHDENYMPPEAAEALRRAGKPIGTPEQFQQKPTTVN